MRATLAGILLLSVGAIPSTAGLSPVSIDLSSQSDRYSEPLQAKKSLQKIARDKDVAKERPSRDKDVAKKRPPSTEQLAKDRQNLEEKVRVQERNKDVIRGEIREQEKGKDHIFPYTIPSSPSQPIGR